jgi:hypothetical protein
MWGAVVVILVTTLVVLISLLIGYAFGVRNRAE